MDYYFIGERELLLAFGLAGVKGTAAVNKNEALEAFMSATGRSSAFVTGSTFSSDSELSHSRPRILIITEEVAVWLEDEILEWQMNGSFPLIVEIPGIHGKLDGKKSLTEEIREAIGIRV